MKADKKAQIWVETVIYTLIGLVLIGTVLAFATPFIAEQKDKAIIGRSSESMNSLDNTILNIKGAGIGNAREFSYLIGKGSLTIDAVNNELEFKVEDSNHEFSEAGVTIPVSGTNMKVRTVENGKNFDVSLTLEYDNVDIAFEDSSNLKTFDAAPNPYRFIIENKGRVPKSDNSCLNNEGGVCVIDNPNDGVCKGDGDCLPLHPKIIFVETS